MCEEDGCFGRRPFIYFPSISLSWALENPSRNATRLQKFLHVLITQDLNVMPPPALKPEDAKFFLRFGAFLAACARHQESGGFPNALKSTRGNASFYFCSTLMVQPLDILQLRDEGVMTLISLKLRSFWARAGASPPSQLSTPARGRYEGKETRSSTSVE